MKKTLTIVAKITAVESKIDLVKKELLKLVEITKEEKGCIQYDLHQDNLNPKIFLFYENWETRELWLNHMRNHHIEKFNIAVRGAIEDFQLHEMSKLD